jgi:two-component system, OmpR family, response regulator
VLAIDDDPAMRKLIADYLAENDVRVTTVATGQEMLRVLAEEAIDAIVLDLRLAGEDGMDLARKVRAESTIPIIMVTGRKEEADRVMGLELGADDYITKPFSLREFRSRVKAALRRGNMAGPALAGNEPIRAGNLEIDFERRSVMLGGESVQLTYVEFEILAAMAAAPGRVFTREMLLEHIWGDSTYRDPRTVDVHIRHLREKLETDAKDPEYLFTVRGVGYRFRDADRD